MELVHTDNGIKVCIRWRDPTATEDTLEHLVQVFQYAPNLLLKLLRRQKTQMDSTKKRVASFISEERKCDKTPPHFMQKNDFRLSS